MLNFIKKLYATRPVKDVAREKLAEAELDLLDAESQLESWESAVPMYRKRVERLRKLLGDNHVL